MSRPDIAIGTAQFGLDYGVTNTRGKISPSEVARILRTASANGCRWLDCAAAYGNAETVVGQLAESAAFQVCTKIGARAQGTPEDLAVEFDHSLRRLGRSSIDVLLLHSSAWLRDARAARVRAWAGSELRAGRIGAFGVSVYETHEVDECWLTGPLDWVQLPLSVLAQDWLRSGKIAALRENGVKVQVRSVLAQGLVALAPEQLPAALESAKPALSALAAAANLRHVTTVRLALAFAAQAPVDMIALGVESAPQLLECLSALEAPMEIDWGQFACEDSRAVDPRHWPPGLRIAQ